MSARIIDGKAVAAQARERVKGEIESEGLHAGLATILVGDDQPSARYIAMKQAKAAELGFNPGHSWRDHVQP